MTRHCLGCRKLIVPGAPTFKVVGQEYCGPHGVAQKRSRFWHLACWQEETKRYEADRAKFEADNAKMLQEALAELKQKENRQ